MSEEGWKWQQATVWSVESGQRGLLLAEAGALAEVLGIRIDELLYDRLQAIVATLSREERRQHGNAARAAANHRDTEEQLEIFWLLAETVAGHDPLPPRTGASLAAAVGGAFSSQDWPDVRDVLAIVGADVSGLAELEKLDQAASDAAMDAQMALRPPRGPAVEAYGRAIIHALPRDKFRWWHQSLAREDDEG